MTGEELRKNRRKHGYTQYKIAEKVGYTQTAISRWERGGRIPQDAIKILSRVFNLPYDDPTTPKRSNEERKRLKKQRVTLLKQINRSADTFSDLPEDDEDLLALKKLVDGK